jgi:hypothetical protein
VTASSDSQFTGAGASGGRYVLNLASRPGLTLGLSDDDSLEVPLGFAFPFQGRTYTSVFVNANGNLTFGAGDDDYSPTVAELLSGRPRIAPLWTDLAPLFGGSITLSQGPGAWTVEFRDIPEFYTDGTSTFSVTLSSSGAVEVRYGATAGSTGGLPRLVGVTPGRGAGNPGASDLSGAGILRATGTTYETFGSGAFDLDLRTLSFVP